MYLADYHTHTRFSPDGSATMTEMAQAALDAGMDEICFTDHVEPLVWGSEERHPPYDWSALTEDFAAAQAALGDQIQLRLGMELGDAEWDPAHVKTLLADAPDFDFVIGSVHLLSERFHGEDLYFFTPENAAQAQAAIEDYLNEALALAKQGGFNVLGNDGRCSIIGREIGFENIGVDANIDTSTHGNEASFEFIVDKNPDYIFAMDRDAAIGTDGAQMAQEIMENELVESTDAYKNGHVVYLAHPNVWYTAEGGIQALNEMLSDLESALL